MMSFSKPQFSQRCMMGSKKCQVILASTCTELKNNHPSDEQHGKVPEVRNDVLWPALNPRATSQTGKEHPTRRKGNRTLIWCCKMVPEFKTQAEQY